jgi:hypothetical protein
MRLVYETLFELDTPIDSRALAASRRRFTTLATFHEVFGLVVALGILLAYLSAPTDAQSPLPGVVHRLINFDS